MTLSAVDIGLVTSRDLPAVRDQLVATWHATYDTLYGVATVDDITARWHSLDILAQQIARPGTMFLMATDVRNRVLGSSYAVATTAGTIHLSRLYIAPVAQGQGIGRRLMSATFAALPPAHTHRLEVEPRNAAAIAFYRREGFIEIGRTSDCGGSSGRPGLIFERQSPPSRLPPDA